MGIMRKAGEVSILPKQAGLSQERSYVLDRGLADFGENLF